MEPFIATVSTTKDTFMKNTKSAAPMAVMTTGLTTTYDSILLENIAWFCENERWGGDLSGVLVAERLGVVMKMPIPVDMLARKKIEAQGGVKPSRGRKRHGGDFGDRHHSRQEVPKGSRTGIMLRGVSGEADIIVEETAVTVTGGGEYWVDGTFRDIKAIEAGTHFGRLVPYTAIVSRDRRVRPPLPMHKVAPPLYTKFASDS